MNDQLRKAVYTFALIGLITAFLILAKSLLIPLTLAGLFAMLLFPVGSWLEKKGFNRILANIACLLILILVVGGIIALLSSQVASFAADVPNMQKQLTTKLNQVQQLIEQRFGMAPADQLSWLKERATELLSSSGSIVSAFVAGAGGTLVTFSLVLLYTFFLLLYRDKLVTFILQIMPIEKHSKTKLAIQEIRLLAQSYLSGVLIVIVVLATMNTVGLLIVGVQPAILLGVIAALLNIIPYIGVLIGSALPILVALISKDTFTPAIAVFAIFYFNQLIENNFLTPNIVGSKISLNPLATILALLVGNMIWGVAGMILFIPLLGIVKVIFDNVDSLRPISYLIGEDVKLKKSRKPGE